MQSRWLSTVESWVNTGVGFILSLGVAHFVFPYYYGSTGSAQTDMTVVGIFTVVSFIRGYAIRRLFNRLTTRKKHEL